MLRMSLSSLWLQDKLAFSLPSKWRGWSWELVAQAFCGAQGSQIWVLSHGHPMGGKLSDGNSYLGFAACLVPCALNHPRDGSSTGTAVGSNPYKHGSCHVSWPLAALGTSFCRLLELAGRFGQGPRIFFTGPCPHWVAPPCIGCGTWSARKLLQTRGWNRLSAH